MPELLTGRALHKVKGRDAERGTSVGALVLLLVGGGFTAGFDKVLMDRVVWPKVIDALGQASGGDTKRVQFRDGCFVMSAAQRPASEEDNCRVPASIRVARPQVLSQFLGRHSALAAEAMPNANLCYRLVALM